MGIKNTVESRFLQPPRNREFEKSKVVANVAKLLRYFFIKGIETAMMDSATWRELVNSARKNSRAELRRGST